jgi:putative addiction module killer protein
MKEIRRTAEFDAWLDGMRDRVTRLRITQRLQRLESGNYGDHKRFSGLIELRLDFGPGYRLYCVERGKILVVVLAGGTKASQEWDIARAIKIAATM